MNTIAQQTKAEAATFIAKMECDTKSKAARKRMAEINVNGFGTYRSNISDEARAVWAEYLASF